MKMHLARLTNDSWTPRSIAFNTVTGLMTDTVTVPLVVLTSVVISRWLGPDQRGIWALLIAANALLANVGSLGTVQSVTVLASRKSFSTGRIHAATIVLSLVLGVACLLIYLAFRPALHGTVLR